MSVSTSFESLVSFFSRAIDDFHSSYRLLPEGPSSDRLTSTISGASEATALGLKSGPDADESTLMYATAFDFKSSANCSPHSVEPVRPTSSPSQLQITIVRFG